MPEEPPTPSSPVRNGQKSCRVECRSTFRASANTRVDRRGQVVLARRAAFRLIRDGRGVEHDTIVRSPRTRVRGLLGSMGGL